VRTVSRITSVRWIFSDPYLGLRSEREAEIELKVACLQERNLVVGMQKIRGVRKNERDRKTDKGAGAGECLPVDRREPRTCNRKGRRAFPSEIKAEWNNRAVDVLSFRSWE
jgi:hypothetical protein